MDGRLAAERRRAHIHGKGGVANSGIIAERRACVRYAAGAGRLVRPEQNAALVGRSAESRRPASGHVRLRARCGISLRRGGIVRHRFIVIDWFRARPIPSQTRSMNLASKALLQGVDA